MLPEGRTMLALSVSGRGTATQIRIPDFSSAGDFPSLRHLMRGTYSDV